MIKIPLVSISCITFNHAAYLRECLDGFLMQKTNFDFEVIIHDDASTDETKSIIEEYNQNHPGVFFPMYQTENQFSKGVRGIMARFNFPRCRGKYIALCEGDDYWTDPLKLQKQVDFLEENEEYSICFHKVHILNNGELVKDFITEERYDEITNFPISQISLFNHSNFIHTPSVVFRKSTEEIPLENKYSPVGDYFLYYWLSQYGYIHRINQVMAVYRHGNGVYSKLSEIKKHKISEIFGLCILSFVSNKEIKEKLLVRNIHILQNYQQQNINNYTIKQLVSFTFRKVFRKIKNFI